MHGDKDEDSDITDSEDSCSSDNSESYNLSSFFLQESSSELHMSSLKLATDIDRHEFQFPWPLTGKDINIEACRGSIPDSHCIVVTLIISMITLRSCPYTKTL